MNIHPKFGFPAFESYRFQIEGRRYRVGKAGLRTLSVLREMYLYARHHDQLSWAIHCRELIEDIERINHSALLSLVVEKSRDEDLRRLAIWMRGRCHGTIGTRSVGAFRYHDNGSMRKEVARALVRMSAWHLVREMSQFESSSRIRSILNQSARRPFSMRLSGFTDRLKFRRVRNRRNKFFVDPDVTLYHSAQPKSIQMIRLLLRRIRRSVSKNSI